MCFCAFTLMIRFVKVANELLGAFHKKFIHRATPLFELCEIQRIEMQNLRHLLAAQGHAIPGKPKDFAFVKISKRFLLTHFDFSNIVTCVNFDYSISVALIQGKRFMETGQLHRAGSVLNIRDNGSRIESSAEKCETLIKPAMVGRVTPCAPSGEAQLRRSDLFVEPPTRKNPSPVGATYSAKIISRTPSMPLPDDAAPDGAWNFFNHVSTNRPLLRSSQQSCTQAQPQRVKVKDRAGIQSRAPFTGDPLRLCLDASACPCPVGTARLRRPRPRSSGRNTQARCVIHASRCAAERGADGASAPSLPNALDRGEIVIRHSSFGFIALCP